MFVGDDASDEGVIGELRPEDIGVRVGADPSRARYRLAAPTDVVAMLDGLAARLVSC
jgi:hypothetical protein